MQNYPNPFNPSTTVRYAVSTTSHVKVQIYNVLGQVVAELVNGEQSAGWYQIKWNAKVASGVYFYRFDAESISEPTERLVQVKKMLLLQ
jgi:flagellar hook assembly protein FlgD